MPQDKRVLLVYVALDWGRGRPHDLFSSLDIDEFANTDSAEVWKKLDCEYLEEKYIEADEPLANCERCRRVPGRAMKDYPMSLTLCRVHMQKEHTGSSVSDLCYAPKMLRCAGLTRVEQRRVLPDPPGTRV